MPRAKEIAEIEVNGQRYRDWKSMAVDRRFPAISTEFTFEVASPIESAPNWAGMKLAIGDEAAVYLAGELVTRGIIRQRQPAYDAVQHALRVGGTSRPGDIVQSSVQTKPGEFKNYGISQIANSLLKPHGITFRLEGDTKGADKPFERVNLQVGEIIFDALDRLCRMRNLFLIDDKEGNLIGYRLPAKSQPIADLVEGKNIKAASAAFDYQGAFSAIEARTQNTGNNQRFGDASRDVSATVTNSAITRHLPLVILAEMPGDNADAKMRAEFELATSMATQLSCQITVQGWHHEDGNLWLNKVGQIVSVYSPMLFTNDRLNLAIEGARSAQGPEGTTTMLTLVLPGRLNGKGAIEGGNASIPQVT